MRRALLALAALLALPAPAAAHSLVRPGGAVVSYLSVDATSLNDLVVRTDGSRIEFRDLAVVGGMDPGTCTPGDVDAQGYIVQTFCPLAPVQRVRIDLGDREDAADVALPIPATVLGGTGSDRITTGAPSDEVDGGTGNDVIATGDGDDVIAGGDGADEIDAGAGADRIAARDGAADAIRCGPGADVVDADSTDHVDASCEGVTSTDVPPDQAAVYDIPGPPGLKVGAAVVQAASRGAAIRVFATASERASVSASGFLAAAGLQIPIVRLPRRAVTVAGGGVQLVYHLRGRHWRIARRTLRRGHRVRVRLTVVATDPGGASRSRRAPAIRLVRRSSRALAARHPTPQDVDGDEILNQFDNCPTVKNGSQLDTDHDAAGDACDEDDDADGVPDTSDNCRIDPNPGQEDTDADGFGDACPPIDSDGDGRIDDDDNCDLVANPDQQDIDGDDKGDACDRDRDGDGFDDPYDNCPDVYNVEPTDTDGDGYLNDQPDADGDGVGTACDPDEATVAAPTATATPAGPPAPAPLEASATTARRQRASVAGRGPIVTVTCSAACDVGVALHAPDGRVLAKGAARLGGAGRTYVFTRFRRRISARTRAVLVATCTPRGGGAETVIKLTFRLVP
jgi:hypothetical protein